MHALAHAGFVHQVDGDLLENAGADPAEHIVGALPLEDDGVDAGLVKQLAQQQPGRARSDDGDLNAHGFLLFSENRWVFQNG